MLLVEKWPIFQLFFFRQYRPGKCFYHILERKNAFLDYKKNKFKKSKHWHFIKEVNPWFWSKNGLFSNFFSLGNIDQETVFYDILERKSAFLGYKNNKFEKSTNWHFTKTHAFGRKMADFPTFSFRQYRPRKCLLRYSKTKKRLSRL